MAAASGVGRAMLTVFGFLALLALSARLVALPLADGVDRRPAILSFAAGSDRSVFAPAAYGEDSQTAVDDDEDIFTSIKNLETQRKNAVGPARTVKVDFFTDTL
jgi:hypothetical protein